MLDVDGWVAQRGSSDLKGASTDDQPAIRIVDSEARSPSGTVLARFDSQGRVDPVAFPKNALTTRFRIDEEGFVVP